MESSNLGEENGYESMQFQETGHGSHYFSPPLSPYPLRDSTPTSTIMSTLSTMSIESMYDSGLGPPILDFFQEPEGHLDLEEYGRHGFPILNIKELVAGKCQCCDVSNVGTVPIIGVDLRHPDAIARVNRSTVRLRREFNLIQVRCYPPLEGEWSPERSMDTIKDKLCKLKSAGGSERSRVETFGWTALNPTPISDDEEVTNNKKSKTKRRVPDTYTKQNIISMAKMKQYCSEANLITPAFVKIRDVLKEWNDVYWIISSMTEKSRPPKDDPSFALFWETTKIQSTLNLYHPEYPLCDRSYHYLKHSPYFDQFLKFPRLDNGSLKQQQYLAGLGNNHIGESIAQLVNHPLQHVLSSLPQCLAIGGALSYWDEDERRQRPKSDSLSYLKKANDFANGTIYSCSYAGTYLSMFPLHCEEAQLPSANLHIAGASKIWIALTEESMDKLQKVVGVPISECHTHHCSVFYHPSFLVRFEIPFNVAFQQPGDLILSDTQGAHQGWNEGNNCTLACNYLDYSSIADIKSAIFHPTMPDVGKWPCVCNPRTRPYLPSIPKNARKKESLVDPWFNFITGVDKAGNSNVQIHGVMMNWIQKVDQQLLTRPDDRQGPRHDALFSIWRHAHAIHTSNVGELLAEQMEVDLEDGVVDLHEARDQPRLLQVPDSTSSRDTARPPKNHRYSTEHPETQYFVEGEDLEEPDDRFLETLDEEMVSL